jgi:UDP-3-O-[3-hydroxymyristoyl] glucosamine N-acyltransferase
MISNQAIAVSEIVARFPEFFLESVGDLSLKIDSVQAPDSSIENSMIFLTTAKAFKTGIRSRARVWVVNRQTKDEALKHLAGRTLLISRNVELSMAKVIHEFFLKTPFISPTFTGIHPSAVIAPSAELAPDVRIGPHVTIGSRVRLGRGVYIGASSVIADDAVVGEGTVIHPLVMIGHSTVIGRFCEIDSSTVIGKEGFGHGHDEKGAHVRIPHQGRVVLEDEVHIGASCTIDRGTFGETRVGAGSKLDNQVHVGHNCSIGKNALITAGFLMAGSSKVGNQFICGGNTAIAGHLEVCDNVQLAGFSGVTKTLTEPGQYGGYPLVPLAQFLKIKAAMVQLPEMRKQLKQVMTKLGL